MRYRYMNEYGARGKHAFMHRFIKTPFDKPFGDDDGPVGGGGGNWWEQPQWDDFAAVPDLENWRFALPAWGAENNPQPNFASDPGWFGAAMVDWSISGGAFNKTGTTLGGGPSLTVGAFQAGTLYAVTYIVASVSGGNVGFRFTGGTSTTPTYRNSPGTYTEYVTTLPGNTNIALAASVAGVTCSITYLSVREVLLTRGGAALGANLGASGYTLKSPAIGTETMTESPAGTLNLTGDGVNSAWADKSLTTVIGRKYRVMFSCATNQASFRVGTSQGGTQNIDAPLPGTGFITYEFTATATTQWVRFSRGSTGVAVVSAIEIRELPATGAFPKRSATFDEFFAFTASSTTAKSYVDSTGTWKNDLAANEPRRDWRTGKQSWRLEDARTNVMLQSQTFDNASWSKLAGAITANQATAPDGTLTADKFISTVGNTGGPFQSVAVTSGTTYTFSVFGKAAEISTLRLQANGSGTVIYDFNLLTGAITSISIAMSSSATVTAYANGWYRCTVSYTAGSTAGYNHFYLTNTVGDGSTGLYLWGAQHEVGAFVSDYIPTTTVAVTRAIETARFSPLVEAVMQRAGGSAVVRGKLDFAVSEQRILGGVTAMGLIRTNATATRMGAYNGTTGLNTGSDAATPYTSPFGAVSAWDSGGRDVGIGGILASDANAIGDRTSVYLARSSNTPTTNPAYGPGNYKLGGAISPERLSNAKLQALAVA